MDMEALLSPYRVLDLTDERGFLCGRILADLGADVIKIEKVGGDPARDIGPFFHDLPDREKSLFWFSYNLNKRGVTLDVESADGREILKRLVKTAHFVIESFEPGYLDNLGLGYEQLKEVNPGLIMTSITAFGQTGVNSRLKASDIVGMAMGGIMHLTGDPDRPPVRMSSPQAYLHAGAEAAAASMIAHYYRRQTGEGQMVDVSMQQCIIGTTLNAMPLWEVDKRLEKRVGPLRSGLSTAAPQLQLWPCKDGFVSFAVMGHGSASFKSIRALITWMENETMSTEHLSGIDWTTWDISEQSRESWNQIEAPILGFFKTKTTMELFRKAIDQGILLMPVMTPRDLADDAQLKHREFWTEIDHPELGASILYPGAFCKISGAEPWKVRRRAPLIGEHNREIYQNELGFSVEEIMILKQSGII